MDKSITVQLSGSIPAGAVRETERGRAVAGWFDLPMARGPARELFGAFTLTIEPGSVMLITGPSGGGKSTILRGIEKGVRERGDVRVVRLEEIGLPGDRPVVDCFAPPQDPLDVTLGHLARAGLSEAQLFLRAPAELSEGQRFRYRLAQSFASSDELLLADEFAATLDRITAKIVAFQLAKYVRGSRGAGRAKSAILATTHEDLLKELCPDIWIYKDLGNTVTIHHGDTEARRT